MKVDLGINPKYIKIAVWILIGIVAVIVIRKIWKKVSESIDRKRLVDKMNQDIVAEELTFTDAQYLQFAQSVYEALNDKSSGFWGVDQKKIYEVYRQMKTPSDILKLHDAFGTREIDTAWTLGADGSYTLSAALPRLLTKGQLRKVNSILRENGVNFSY